MNQNTKFKVDIIGSGISGLSTAHYLSKVAGERVQIRIWERDDIIGGLAGCFKTPDYTVEKFYHHIYRKDTAIQELITELGLNSELIWKPATTGAYYFQQPFRLSSPLDLLKFKPLPLLDRIKMGMMVLKAKKVRDWKLLDNQSARDFICSYSSQNVYQTLWEPLLKGKFGKHHESISAAWLWSKLVDRGGSRDRGGFESLAYLRGGLNRLFDAMVKDLELKGHRIFLKTPIQKLLFNGKQKITSIRTPAEELATDMVICCTQVPDLIPLLNGHSGSYLNDLKKIQFLANVCLILTLNRSLSDFYWTNVTDPKAPFVGIVEHTNWANLDEFNQKRLAYISAYLPHDDSRMRMSADELFEYYFPFVQKMFPKFKKDQVLSKLKWTAAYTQPIVHVGYHHDIPPIESPLKNLYLCTMAQIYPQDRQISNGVEMAIKTVDRVHANLMRS